MCRLCDEKPLVAGLPVCPLGVFDVIAILQLVQEHDEQMEELRCSLGDMHEEELKPLEQCTEALSVRYVKEVNGSAVGLLANMRAVEEPSMDEDELCSSDLPNDLFKIVWENTEFAQSSGSQASHPPPLVMLEGEGRAIPCDWRLLPL